MLPSDAPRIIEKVSVRNSISILDVPEELINYNKRLSLHIGNVTLHISICFFPWIFTHYFACDKFGVSFNLFFSNCEQHEKENANKNRDVNKLPFNFHRTSLRENKFRDVEKPQIEFSIDNNERQFPNYLHIDLFVAL